MIINRIVAVLIVFVMYSGLSAQSINGKAYKTGNYVFCGKELPKHFSYLIEKKLSTDTIWHTVAELKSPINEEGCKAAIMDLPPAIASLTVVEDPAIHFFWQRLQTSFVADSLYSYALDPRYQSAAGIAWFDNNIKQPGNYQYRINKLNKSGSKTLVNDVTITFPDNSFNGSLRAARFQLAGNSIDISYEVNDSLNTAGVKIYRSLFKQNKFIEINPSLLFTKQKNRIVALVTDASVIKGLTYSYYAIPFDALGNPGRTTDTLNIYNVSKQADIGIITSFEAIPVTEPHGIELKWIYKSNLNTTSIEVFRSSSYDGAYTNIASLSPAATHYFDASKLKPAITYYYYIVINNGYGNSLPSARTPAILKGNKRNFLPPQNLTLSRKENVVTLTFHRLDRDTRGYYVYRADGYIAPLQQLPRILLSTDSIATYNDTLPKTATPAVYSYAVASVNTSYNISPQSERVNVRFSGGMLPIPNRVNAMLNQKSIFVTWENMSNFNSAVTGYKIYRRSDVKDHETEPEKVIATTANIANSYTDTLLIDGRHYSYRVQSVGLDSTDVSSLSMPAGVLFPERLPLQPGLVSAIAASTKILLKWTLPADESLSKIKIYRATENQQAELMKELSPPSEMYEDTSVQPGTMYFYYVITVNKKGKESNPTDAVSAKL
jgi:fibronectin type 3 domain-containing protein